jgi:hypothetical protein
MREIMFRLAGAAVLSLSAVACGAAPDGPDSASQADDVSVPSNNVPYKPVHPYLVATHPPRANDAVRGSCESYFGGHTVQVQCWIMFSPNGAYPWNYLSGTQVQGAPDAKATITWPCARNYWYVTSAFGRTRWSNGTWSAWKELRSSTMIQGPSSCPKAYE